MLARPIARRVNQSPVGRFLLILPIFLVLLVSERAGAQSCYQFSNAHGGTPATVIATFPLTTIPASIVRPGRGDMDYTAAFSSAPGLQNTQVSYSPTHIATIIERGIPHTFNMFTVTIMREGTRRRFQFDGTNYPPTDPENTFSVFIQQDASVSADPFPAGLTATPPPFSVWGDRPASSIDLGHVKLASVSFVGPCTDRR